MGPMSQGAVSSLIPHLIARAGDNRQLLQLFAAWFPLTHPALYCPFHRGHATSACSARDVIPKCHRDENGFGRSQPKDPGYQLPRCPPCCLPEGRARCIRVRKPGRCPIFFSLYSSKDVFSSRKSRIIRFCHGNMLLGMQMHNWKRWKPLFLIIRWQKPKTLQYSMYFETRKIILSSVIFFRRTVLSPKKELLDGECRRNE